MQKKLMFFVNPRAGHSEIRGSLMQVIQIFTAGGYGQSGTDIGKAGGGF